VNPERGVSLARFTSLRVGGPAEFFVLARSATDFADALAWAHAKGTPVRVIGGGSNLLVSDSGVAGLVIKAANTHASVEERHGQPVVVAEAGANLANLARRLAKQGLGGLEWAANVPGTVGGAAVNNAGAFGGDTAACLVSLSSSTRIVPACSRTALWGTWRSSASSYACTPALPTLLAGWSSSSTRSACDRSHAF
jgi:UDP-N-acetylmuramate dehydrogenase